MHCDSVVPTFPAPSPFVEVHFVQFTCVPAVMGRLARFWPCAGACIVAVDPVVSRRLVLAAAPRGSGCLGVPGRQHRAGVPALQRVAARAPVTPHHRGEPTLLSIERWFVIIPDYGTGGTWSKLCSARRRHACGRREGVGDAHGVFHPRFQEKSQTHTHTAAVS